MTEKIESHKLSLKEILSDILNANTLIAVGLMGVGIGWDDSGAERFEVRLSAEVDDETLSLLPATHQGFSVNYEKVGEIRFQ